MVVSAGELVARCTGPRSMAICTLLDRRDGTYELIIQPQETGTHNLEISYGSEPIPGLSVKIICTN